MSDSKISAKEIKILHTFYDDTMAPAYIYQGDEYPARLINWWVQAPILIDLNNDGIKDVVLPISKGYATGIDGSTPFIALTTSDGSLIFDQTINSKMPITTGAKRSEKITLVNTDYDSFVTTNNDTAQMKDRDNPERTIPQSELNLIQPLSSNITREDIFPKLLDSTNTNPYEADAHSLATGDINGDGLEDIFVGSAGGGKKAYTLLQSEDGSFIINKQDIFSNYKILGTNEVALVDVNNDNFYDIIASQGTEKDSSLIFINKNGQFSENNTINLPVSEYGSDNQLHNDTLANDFDHDGDTDLAIMWTRKDPFSSGTYIQILSNDGKGNYQDKTSEIPENALKDAYKNGGWAEYWQLFDFNNDGHMDIGGISSEEDVSLGSEAFGGFPVIYFNDGKGRFNIEYISLDKLNGVPLIFSDFDQDNLIEFVTFKSGWSNVEGTESQSTIHLYELTNEIGTGPSNSTDTAEQSAPGFNERYYLNENSSAQEAITAGTYDTGLAHYLAEGKDAGLKTFAPFTKVHGYSGNDTIVLREGDEIAYGYAGNDSIEGGAGNDTY
jgi:hypothetical protein